MTWTCPEIIEICVGMEITSYEFRRNLIQPMKARLRRRSTGASPLPASADWPLRQTANP